MLLYLLQLTQIVTNIFKKISDCETLKKKTFYFHKVPTYLLIQNIIKMKLYNNCALKFK